MCYVRDPVVIVRDGIDLQSDTDGLDLSFMQLQLILSIDMQLWMFLSA